MENIQIHTDILYNILKYKTESINDEFILYSHLLPNIYSQCASASNPKQIVDAALVQPQGQSLQRRKCWGHTGWMNEWMASAVEVVSPGTLNLDYWCLAKQDLWDGVRGWLERLLEMSPVPLLIKPVPEQPCPQWIIDLENSLAPNK